MLLLILAGLGVACWRYGPPLFERGRLLYWQRQCLSFEPPAELVAFESDPTLAATLIASRSHQPLGAYEYPPEGSLQWARPPFAALGLECWDWFSIYSKDPHRIYSAQVYLHERRSPSGKRLLVAVYATVPVFGDEFKLHNKVIEPATWFRPAAIVGEDSNFYVLSLHALQVFDAGVRARQLRFSVGRSDPTDLSRFSIPFELLGQRNTLHGRVDDDGAVHFEPQVELPRVDPALDPPNMPPPAGGLQIGPAR